MPTPPNLLMHKAFDNFIWDRYAGIDMRGKILDLKGQRVNQIVRFQYL